MQYVFKNKLVSLGGGSHIRDLDGLDRFYVKGRFFTFTNKKLLKDLDGNTLYIIQNKFFTWLLPKIYIKDKAGNIIATLKKEKLFSFKGNFVILSDKIDCRIDGDYFSFQSRIVINGQVVACIDRQFNLVRDAFVVDVIDENYTNFVLALVTALDNYRDGKNSD